MELKKLSAAAKEIILVQAKQEAKYFVAQEVLAEHVALAILKKKPPIITQIFLHYGIKINSILAFFEELIDRPSPRKPRKTVIAEPIYGEEMTKMLAKATTEATNFHSNEIKEEHLFLAILSDCDSSLFQCVSKFPITTDGFRIALSNLLAPITSSTSKGHHSTDHRPHTFNEDFAKVCTNLNERMKNKTFMTICERDNEILQIIQILKRQTKNNPLLIGEAGVGKTAIVEALAYQINQKETPSFLYNVEIFELHVASLLAGTRYRGDFEERLSSIIKIFEENENFILFIDEIHLIAGSGSSQESALDIANILKPALARGLIKCIGATTYKEYQQYLQSDSALDRRFQRINIAEPNDHQMNYILQTSKQYYETNHHVLYPSTILQHLIHLSKIHFPNRVMPDKVLDLMDEVGANKNLSKYRLKTQLTQTERSLHTLYESLQEYDESLSDPTTSNNADLLFLYNQLRKDYEYLYDRWQNINTKEDVKTISLEDLLITLSDKLKINGYFFHPNEDFFPQTIIHKLEKTIVGHKKTIYQLVAHYVDAFRKYYFQPKPLLSLLLVGSREVGKRSIIQQIHSLTHQDNSGFLYINLAHINTPSSIKDLLSDHHINYTPSTHSIIQSIKTHPQITLYFDNIEQAHPDFYIHLKTMLNDAKIIGSSGQTYYLYNTIIILATSLLSQQAKSSFHYYDSEEQQATSQAIDECLLPHLQCQISSLTDYTHFFESLSSADMKKLFFIQWHHLEDSLNHLPYKIMPTSKLEDYFVKKSEYQPHYLIRLFEQQLKRPLMHILTRIPTTCQKKLIIVNYDEEKESIMLEEKESDTSWQNA